MTGVRAVAVDRGTDATRLVVPGPDGGPEPVAVLPAGTTAATALDELVGRSCGPVALVHPPGWSAARIAEAVAALGDRDVRPVPAPVAVLAGPADPTAARLVVDAGRSGTDLTLVDDGCVRSTERVPVGGDRLDEELAAALGCPPSVARAAREALSTDDEVDVAGAGPVGAARVGPLLRPAFDDVVARVSSRVMSAGVVEVVAAGGLARTPLLAVLLDERAGCPVRVLPEPDLAAVRGALRWLEREPGPSSPRRAATRATAIDPDGDPDDDADLPDRAGEACRRPVDARDRTPARRSRLPAVVAVIGALLVGTGSVLGPAPAPPDRTLVQYGYAVALPGGWEHTGGDPRRRRTLLGRVGSPDGVELLSVERSPLGYDSATEPDRARADLAAAHRAVADVGDLGPDTVAGRAVTHYRQRAGPDAVVDWYVIFDGTDELAVGCRRPARGPAPETERACGEVVGSVRIEGPPD